MIRSTCVNILILVSVSVFSSSSSLAQRKDTLSIDHRLQQIENQLSEVRRDQLNYSIERDLLKETFSTNYQTINVVLAIILGIFSIVGFLGIRDIGTIRKEYSGELEHVNELRRDLELKVNQIGEVQQKVQTDYLEIIRTNEEQNRRIKVLELQEKIGALMKGNNYQRGLEYIAVAIDIDPDNAILLEQKAMCLWKVGDLQGAASTFCTILEHDPSNKSALLNLLEVYLILNRLDDYHSLYSKNKSIVDGRDELMLTNYFSALENYQLGNEEFLETLIKQLLDTPATEKKKRTSWNFGDVLVFLKSQPESRKKNLFSITINLLNGDIETAEAKKRMKEAK